jgi:CBS domain-containing protein
MVSSRNVLTAERVMQRNVFVLYPEMQVLDAVEELLQRGASSAPVLDDGRIVGLFSERDALVAIAGVRYEGAPVGTVEEHMQRDFEVVGARTELHEIAACFREVTARRLPVVDHRRRLLGMVSRSDVLRVLRHAASG